MKGYLIFWIALFVALTISIYLTGGEGFGMWYRRRHSWPMWRGRYGWGSRWGWDPQMQYATYMEPFSNDESVNSVKTVKTDASVDKLYEFPPNAPAELIKSATEPYQLLNDVFPPANSGAPPETLSKTTAQSCFMGNFERLLEPTGNFRQMTNNFKHGYPDSCTAPYHELVMPFYKGDGMRIGVADGCI